jgi:type II restriction enzyme
VVDIEDLIESCIESQGYFFKFISPNDTSRTGAHQSGIYMPKAVWSLFFETPGTKDEKKDALIRVRWHDGRETDSRFIWYASKTEYRLTRGASFLTSDEVGDLFVMARVGTSEYRAYVLSSDEETEAFLVGLGLSPEDAGRIHRSRARQIAEVEDEFIVMFNRWIATVKEDFPVTATVSRTAREFVEALRRGTAGTTPDQDIVEWIDAEYRLFRLIEESRYVEYLTKPFQSVELLVEVANRILNRRKSRAGRSLENHLEHLFTRLQIPYTNNGKTEGNKQPDFIFPGIAEYRDRSFPTEHLRFLGAKTTCKDRWRQILNEANRIEIKHLMTLQQSISANQLREMQEENVILVVPATNVRSFPREYQPKLITLERYVDELVGLYRVRPN